MWKALLERFNLCSGRMCLSSASQVQAKTYPFATRFFVAPGRAIQGPRLATLPIANNGRLNNDMNSTLETQLLHEIETNAVVIFGESQCLKCASAKKKFKKLGIDPVVFYIDRGEPHVAAEVKSILGVMAGEFSFPHVFVAGKYLSGVEALDSKLKHVKALVGKRTLEMDVRKEIETKFVVVFAQLYCPLCIYVRRAFRDAGHDPAVFEIDSDKLRGNRQLSDDLHDILVEMTKIHSFPYVFVGGTFVGGYEEIARRVACREMTSLVGTHAEEKMSLRDSVRTEIHSNSVVVFSGSSSRLRSEAKLALEQLPVEPVFFDLDAGEIDAVEEVAQILSEMTAGSALPCIFIAGEFVGSNDALVALAASEQLAKLVHAGGAAGDKHETHEPYCNSPLAMERSVMESLRCHAI